MGYKIAVVGATGNVGRELLNIIDERKIPVEKLHALASSRSVGREVSYGEDHNTLPVESLEHFDFSKVDFVLSSAGGEVAKEFAPKAAKAGAIVIDNSSAFRMDPNVPLVVPEVNAEALKTHQGIIANPNCSTIQLMVALKPIHDKAKVKRVVVSTYQSVSGAGKAAMDELFNQTRSVFVAETMKGTEFPKQIAFNVIPQIDSFMDDRSTKEEWKMKAETMKILGKDVKLVATCVRVPVFIGHAVAAHIETENEISAIEAMELFRSTAGITLIDLENEELEYMTPQEIQGEDDVYISRVREDSTVDNGLAFWCVADNLRKGAALNAVQILERLIAH